MLSFQRCSALFTVLLCLLWICSISAQTHEDTQCDHEHIPASFDTISYLKFNKEFHVQGRFLINTNKLEEEIFFNLSTPSVIRAYIAPHEIDVDIWLYDYNGRIPVAIAHSSLDIGTEEVVFASLNAGNYSISLPYFGLWIGTYDPTQCETLTMEVAIEPQTVLASRVRNVACGSSEVLPTVNIPTLSGSPFSYNSDTNQSGIVSMFADHRLPSAQTFVS